MAQARMGEVNEQFIEADSDVNWVEAQHTLRNEIMSCLAVRKEEKLKTPEPEYLTVGDL